LQTGERPFLSFSGPGAAADGCLLADSHQGGGATNCGSSGYCVNGVTDKNAHNDGATAPPTVNTTGRLKGSIFQMPEVGAPGCAASSDFLWPDSTAHRLKMCNNNAASTNVVGASEMPLSPTSASFSPGSLTAGACATQSATRVSRARRPRWSVVSRRPLIREPEFHGWASSAQAPARSASATPVAAH